MIVIGGTYEEIVVVPDSHELRGSGLRAVAALANREEPPTFHTVLDVSAERLEEAELVAGSLGVTLAGNNPSRSEPVAFRYITPISAPAVNGPNSRLLEGQIVVGSDRVALVFGLIEAPSSGVSVTAETVVFDPQRPRDAEPVNLQNFNEAQVIMVANSTEIRKIGASRDIREAATRILDANPNVSGVVTKRGAAGCIVSERMRIGSVRHDSVGAHPTSRVWPIGSGDTFSAGLAHAIDLDADLVDAARLGAAAAAHWCSTKNPAIPAALLSGDYSMLPRPVEPTSPRIYLASPFFSVSERWLVESVRDELHSLGADVWSPVHEVGHGGLEVAQKDLDGLLGCDAVIALLDHGDPGTVFEVGWAVRHGIPVVGYGTSVNPDGIKMLAGTRVELHRDLSTACYRAVWAGMGLRPVPGWVT